MSALGSVLEVTVASRDLERQRRFCQEAFQFETLARDATSVLLGVPGSERGRLRLVPARADPGLPPPDVRETGARVLGVYSRDVPRTHQLVTAAGVAPRPYTSFEVPGVGSYTEGSVHAFDDLIWFYPCPSRPLPSPALAGDPARIHGELHYVALTVPEVAPALEFFAGGGGMKVILDEKIAETWACDLIGVPHGTKIHMVCLAGEDAAPIRLMLTAFSGTQPPRAREVGIRRISFSADPAAIQDRLVRAGAQSLGAGLLRGPAGVEIELRLT